MTIMWYGHACFKIETREATLAIDPFSKNIGIAAPRFQADVILMSHEHPAHANAESIGGTPRVITGPGEYEVKGVAITGIPSFHDAAKGQERGLNTIWRITADGMTIAHLGDFGEKDLRAETLEALGAVDILLIPVGGAPHTIAGETAAAIANRIEPKIVIPMHYAIPGLSVDIASPDAFLKAFGASAPERLPKFAIRSKELPAEEETRLVLLAAGGER
ncbi:lactamase [Candidatus Parcubacteria bacterium]|nr:MAG: lactamase [Candidatus Parcubacteria bacterium]